MLSERRCPRGSGLNAEAKLSQRYPSACVSSSAVTRSLHPESTLDPETAVLLHRSWQEHVMAAIFMTSLVSPAAESKGPTHSAPSYSCGSYVEPDGQHIRVKLASNSKGCSPALKGRAAPGRPQLSGEVC